MTERDKPAFVAVLNGLAAVKPGAKLTTESYEVWWMAMKDWSIEDFKAAAVTLIRTVEFMPSPFHFEQLRRRAGEHAADEAWSAVLANLRSGQYRRGETVGGKADRIVRAMGGYASLAMRDSQALHTFGARQFREFWDEIGEQEEARAALPHLAPPPVSTLRLTGPRPAAEALRAIAPTRTD